MLRLNTLITHPAPLHEDVHGVIRVGHTRVTLQSVLNSFKQGNDPLTIKEQFPSLELADIYAVVSYYNWNRMEMDAFLEECRREFDTARDEIEQRHPSDVLRRLQTLRAAKEKQ